MNIRELPNLDRIMGFRGNYARYKVKEDNGQLTIGLVDRNGEIVWDAHSRLPIISMSDTVFMGYPISGNGWKYFDVVKQIEVPRPALKHVFKGGYFLMNDQDKWALFIAEKQVTDYIFDNIVSLENPIATKAGKDLCVRQGGKSFYINEKGERVSKEYDYLEPTTQSDYALAKIDGKIWVMTGNELPLAMTKWEDTWCKIEGKGEAYHRGLKWITPDWLLFAEGEKWGIMNPYGGIVLPCKYDCIYANEDGETFLIEANGSWGLMHKNSIESETFDWMLPCAYQSLSKVDDYFIAKRNNMVGVIDKEGKEIIPFEYDNLFPARDEKLELISAKKDGECFFINIKNERVELY